MKKDNLNSFNYEQILLDESSQEINGIDSYDKKIIEELEKSNLDILDKYPPSSMADSIKRRMKNDNKSIKGNFNRKKLYIPLTTAAVFLLMFPVFSILLQKDQIISNQPEVIRMKGNTPSIYIYKRNNENFELLANNSFVKEKDLLQISYDGAGVKYGIILSIDGRGTVTLHFPENIYSSSRLDFGGKVALPFSYELDNAPFFERFFFITSNDEILIEDILDKAARIAQGNKSEILNLDKGIDQQTIILFKEDQ